MLEEYKHICKNQITDIPDWEQLGKNELCFEYIKHEDDEKLKSQYFSAILYKYWNAIGKYYAKSSNICDPEDIYELLVDAITYALEKRRWEDEDSSIYQDPKGPDKVINRFLSCRRDTMFQQHNRKKRKDQYGLVSLDAIKDDFADNSEIFEDRTQYVTDLNFDINDFIKQMFECKDYFMAYMIDMIAHEDVFCINNDKQVQTFNVNKLIRKIQQIDTSYVARFADRFEVRKDIAINSLKYICNLDAADIRQKIEYNFGRLSHNNNFKEILGKSC